MKVKRYSGGGVVCRRQLQREDRGRQREKKISDYSNEQFVKMKTKDNSREGKTEGLSNRNQHGTVIQINPSPPGLYNYIHPLTTPVIIDM
jgi:hypothetical protein